MKPKTKLIIINEKKGEHTIPIVIEPRKDEAIYTVVLVRLSGSARVRITSHQNHRVEGATSDFLCKTVLDGSSEFVYEGIITIAKGAQKSHAYQRNENLVLSPQVRVRSEPKLEILASDVFCTHGVTTSGINEEQLWFLQSRGCEAEMAQKLITQGFLYSGLDRLVMAGEPYEKVYNEAHAQLTV